MCGQIYIGLGGHDLCVYGMVLHFRYLCFQFCHQQGINVYEMI